MNHCRSKKLHDKSIRNEFNKNVITVILTMLHFGTVCMWVGGGGCPYTLLLHKNLLKLPETSHNSSYTGTQGMSIFLFKTYPPHPPDIHKPCLHTSAWQQCSTNSTWATLTRPIRRLQLQTSTADELSSVILQVCTAPNSQLSIPLLTPAQAHEIYRRVAWPHSHF